jgi:pimeloyl-ACP methyl ester carboxylesterase
MNSKNIGDPAWAALIRDNQWTRTMDMDGYSLNYLDAGAGPVVVMLHGFGDSIYSWRWNIQAFVDADYRVLALDLPGMGLSGKPHDFAFTPSAMANAVAIFLNRLNIERAIFVGNSLGGNVALCLAIHYPALIDRLVMVDPACYPLGLRQRVITSALRCGLVKKFVRLFIGPWIIKAAYWQAFHNPRLIRPEMAAESSRFLELPDGPSNLLETAEQYFDEEYRRLHFRYHEIQAPSLLIWGRYDRVIPTRPNAKKLHKAIPRSRLVIMPDVGHAPHQEQPEAFNSLVISHLKGS